MIRFTVSAAVIVWSVERTRCPVSASVSTVVANNVLVLLDNPGDLLRGTVPLSARAYNTGLLTLTLRNLERDGILTRTSHPEVPPRVEYELSPIGRGLAVPAGAVAGWAIANVEEIQDARARFDARAEAS